MTSQQENILKKDLSAVIYRTVVPYYKVQENKCFILVFEKEDGHDLGKRKRRRNPQERKEN